MRITALKLINFRNYQELDLEFSNHGNILIGNNAQGKTNLLEAIYMIGSTKSFRRVNDDQLLKIGENNAKISAEIFKKDVKKRVKFEFIAKSGKKIWVNGKINGKISNYLGNINVILFFPEDLMLIKGEAACRRRFIDSLLCQTDNIYLSYLINFQRVLKQRNMLLKDIQAGKKVRDILDPWDEQLVSFAGVIAKKRGILIKKINKTLEMIYKKLNTEEKVEIKYKDSIFKGENFEEEEYVNVYKNKLKSINFEEICKGTTIIGPHRDELEIKLDDLSARFYSSQGQQRTIAVSLRMAEVEYVYSIFSEYPILLLDDLFSELDDKRKEYFTNFLNQEMQVFITGTRFSDFSRLIPRARIFKINQGKAAVYKSE
ncbi:DNA replication/repair protein RecF [bacterium]|nr:DNA replication/repair protein RecF [bacterium]